MNGYTLKPTPKRRKSILARLLYRWGYALHRLPKKHTRKRKATPQEGG
jgi:hypothetical protein